ncbi:hypothetical protein JKA73_37470 [Myxococcus xanthus]|uniref:hypothetical protein n=1 Tax=Myxococcus xanthus TaxID=34 RepID=UPI0019179A53|nr:hypothetical protein [Myxococcus xanthus]QQR44576.1 hypothetical protein JKA73_37470 [Myxococcus xanthus]
MVDETRSASAQELAALGIKPEDVRAMVMLMAVTGRKQEDILVEPSGAGIVARTVKPLPDEDTVRKLAVRLSSVELRLKETNEKLDRVLAALERK